MQKRRLGLTAAKKLGFELGFSLRLLDTLLQTARRDRAGFFAPGHKQGQGASVRLRELLGDRALLADLPELPELDNLFAPEGAIASAQTDAAQVFGAEQTWFLVNGSTCGLIAAILATCGEGDKIILPRNVHQSVIAGLILSGAMPIFLNPPYDADRDLAYTLTPDAIQAALDTHPDTKAVLIVSPTYQGVCAEVDKIAAIAHRHDIPLIVDEAHGAHFAFHPDLPPTALQGGADLVVQSTHKVLGALTQASMLHRQGDRVSVERINRALQWVQTTSPSYLLLASLDAATAQMATEGTALMAQTLALAHRARQGIAHPILMPPPTPEPGFAALDLTRLTVLVRDLALNGFAIDEFFHAELGVTAELPLANHLTFIISLGNTTTDIDRLIAAWQQIEPPEALLTRERQAAQNLTSSWGASLAKGAEKAGGLPHLSPRQASFAPTQPCPLDQAVGAISAALVCPYPPGIPLLMPGEEITAGAIATLQHLQTLGGRITGLTDPHTIQVISPSR